jgi:diguanylate cyclase
MMRLSWRRKTPDEACDPAELAERLERAESMQAAYRHCLQVLVALMKHYVLDQPEIGSEAFREEVDRFGRQLLACPAPRQLEACTAKRGPALEAYSLKQKTYLEERERELRNIIDILTEAMAATDSENQSYHQTIYAQSEKIEQISRLDDIRKVKSALEQAVDGLRVTVRAKQERERARVDRLAEQVSVLNDELQKAREASLRDSLTGAYNRKAFDEHLAQLMERQLIRPRPFALLMLDIDDFKGINDTYGHLLGDRVLLAVAQTCRDLVRADDFVARFGGEEFAILLPAASLRQAAKTAKRIVQTIARTRYALQEEPGAPAIALTVSVGVSALRGDDSPQTLISRADEALYAAKRSGKNRATTA